MSEEQLIYKDKNVCPYFNSDLCSKIGLEGGDGLQLKTMIYAVKSKQINKQSPESIKQHGAARGAISEERTLTNFAVFCQCCNHVSFQWLWSSAFPPEVLHSDGSLEIKNIELKLPFSSGIPRHKLHDKHLGSQHLCSSFCLNLQTSYSCLLW